MDQNGPGVFYPLNFVGSINMVTFAHVELLLPHRKKHAFWACDSANSSSYTETDT